MTTKSISRLVRLGDHAAAFAQSVYADDFRSTPGPPARSPFVCATNENIGPEPGRVGRRAAENVRSRVRCDPGRRAIANLAGGRDSEEPGGIGADEIHKNRRGIGSPVEEAGRDVHGLSRLRR